MLRRPPGEGRHVAQQRKVLLALAVFLLPWLQLVDARQQQHRQQSPTEQAPVANYLNDNGNDNNNIAVNKHDVHDRDIHSHQYEPTFDADQVVSGNLAAAATPSKARSAHEAPNASRRGAMATANERLIEKKRLGNIHIPNDASALATLAPAQPVRAPNSPRHLPSLLAGAGLSSPQTARSLEKWEVEDYILLATVDGHLYAVNRESGDERWHLQVEQPIVETIHHRPNSSFLDDQENRDHHPLDDYVWAVEPTHNGALYVWTPSGFGSGLMSTGFTMKQLVEDFGSYAVQNPPVVYTGHKKTTMITLDAATGRVLKWFGQAGSQVDQSATCYPPNGRFVDSDSQECSDSGTITLSRTEYAVTIHRLDDGREIATLRYAEWGPNNFDSDLHQQYRATQDNRYFTSQHDGKVYALAHPTGATSFALQFSVPVARVFDIARPEDAPPGSNPELVLLPQPTPPVRDEDSARARSHSVFLNQTESGSWYAMSGWSYPLIVDAPAARISHRNRWDSENSWDTLNTASAGASLVGTHILGNARSVPQWPQSLPPSLPSRPFPEESDNDDNESAVPSPFPDPESESTSLVNRVGTIPQYAADKTLDFLMNPILFPVLIYLLFRYYKDLIRWSKRQFRSREYSDALPYVSSTDPSATPPLEIVTDEARMLGLESVEKLPEPPASAQVGGSEKTVRTATTIFEPEAVEADGEREQQQTEGESPEKKKKAHRGRRGGVKHRKGAKKQRDVSENPGDRVSSDAGEGIPGLQNVGVPSKLEPNVVTINNDPEDVSGPIVKIGGIEVNQDEQLGMGSNGTIVFAGKFHGRDVAVKRMLTQFWDIATQETQLLLESDHHPNVIRYFAMSKNDSFLYIALELCQASLSDIIEKPAMYRDLAQAGETDLPRVLLQIAHGLGFLHDLRIVHRDLKPQNILVTMGRDGKPRLLVSDFGLCKKLEGGQSSFGATTAHAAGTSGWRAPELLLDDDAREISTMSMTSTHSDSSQLVSADVMPNRRATRAIDIFSLGLVFFYVLTKGLHPFDCGDRYMREVNIRKGQFNLKPLDVLGDFAHEAKALIETMLRSDPRARPSAKDVMSHPFFWSAKERLAFLCDVSDHFELEPRDPPSENLMELETRAPQVCRGDFLKVLPKEFVDSLGKQRKYTGSRLLDLLRALRNKRFHYGDMSEPLKKMVGPLPDGYLSFWTRRFPNLLIVCCTVIYKLNLEELDAFKEYFEPRTPL
ncbi:bifunctional endoribonuclease/protein kinase ire1 [Parahypoxylon ruwenzoriense]